MKAVMDSSSIISISDTCLIEILGKLKDSAGIEFIIPASVERESVLRPLNIKRFELKAIRIKRAIAEGWIEVHSLGSEGNKLTDEIEHLANHSFYHKGRPVKLIHKGEAETLALAKVLDAQTLVIDERTARALVENPSRIKSVMERRREMEIEVDRKNISHLRSLFPELNIVRSAELIALAYEKGLLNGKPTPSKNMLEAALYAVKYAGCAVSSLEIEKFLKGI